MNLLESFLLAIDAIIANKMRSALTTLGIVIGVCAVILLVSVGQGVRDSVTEQIRGIGSNLLIVMPGEVEFGSGQEPSFTNKLRVEHVRTIEREALYAKQVSAATENRGSVKFGSTSRRSMVYGVTANYADMTNFAVESGGFLTET
ncbi:MAG TPA: ABC transporter permease, partial [Anaerolineae bacterium]|nr:ABC transporter permease [Anaerolineae bacterium]